MDHIDYHRTNRIDLSPEEIAEAELARRHSELSRLRQRFGSVTLDKFTFNDSLLLTRAFGHPRQLQGNDFEQLQDLERRIFNEPICRLGDGEEST